MRSGESRLSALSGLSGVSLLNEILLEEYVVDFTRAGSVEPVQAHLHAEPDAEVVAGTTQGRFRRASSTIGRSSNTNTNIKPPRSGSRLRNAARPGEREVGRNGRGLQGTVTIHKRYLQNAKVIMATVPAMLAGTGCYEYQASSLSSVKPGESVHLVLNHEGAASLAADRPERREPRRQDHSHLADRGHRGHHANRPDPVGPEEFMKDEPLSVPAAGATSVTVRSLDKPRTVLAIAAILTGVVLGNVIVNQAGIFATKSVPSGSTK